MAQWIVRTPVEGYTGISAGVAFSDGVAVVDDLSHGPALRYFRSAGYGVSPADPAPTSTAISRAVDVEQPPRSASKVEWVEWVVANVGESSRSDIEAMTKAQIIKEFG